MHDCVVCVRVCVCYVCVRECLCVCVVLMCFMYQDMCVLCVCAQAHVYNICECASVHMHTRNP